MPGKTRVAVFGCADAARRSRGLRNARVNLLQFVSRVDTRGRSRRETCGNLCRLPKPTIRRRFLYPGEEAMVSPPLEQLAQTSGRAEIQGPFPLARGVQICTERREMTPAR